MGRTVKSIDDEIVRAWVRGLPDCRPLHLVSLLGQKPPPNTISEYSYYSFRGGHEPQPQRPEALTFQEWLNVNFAESHFEVTDFPTIDTKPIDNSYLIEICDRIQSLLSASVNVLVFDSGGFGRSGKVCARLGAKS